MSHLSLNYMGAVRRCVGDAVAPEASEVELVAEKIWRDCAPERIGPSGWPHDCGNREYYRRAARIALEGRPHHLAL